MTPNPPLQRFPLIASAAVMLLATGLAAVAVEGTLLALGWKQQALPCGVAAALCGGSALMTLIPVWFLAQRRGAEGAAFGFLGGMLLRMLICGVGVVALKKPIGDSVAPWIGAWYMIALMIEVSLIGRYLVQLPRPRTA